MNKNPRQVGPWCAPNQRTQFGKRVVGHVHDGDKWKDFLVDDQGKEHDPEIISDRAWSYLERTGDAKKIQNALGKDAQHSTMTLISINPVIVILDRYLDASALKVKRDFAYQRWYWRSQVHPGGDPPFREGMRWFSPDLKQKPTDLAFSPNGLAEIPLPGGKLELVREGDACKTARK
jgi:hypothetical protein